jgi:hypothetical protein
MALWISCCGCVRNDFHQETPFQILSVTLGRKRLYCLSCRRILPRTGRIRRIGASRPSSSARIHAPSPTLPRQCGRTCWRASARSPFTQAAWVMLVKPKSWERHGLKSWIEPAKKRLHHNVLAIAHDAGGRLARSALDLAARPLLPQDDAAIAVMADNVERVLPDVDTDDCALGACCLGHMGCSFRCSPKLSVARWRGRSTAAPSQEKSNASAAQRQHLVLVSGSYHERRWLHFR